MNRYPESLSDRCRYLEQENEKMRTALVEVCAEKDRYIHNLRLELKNAKEFIERDQEYSRLWVWQGDGYDYLRSMANDTPVLITAHELRQLVENGETVAEGGSDPVVAKAKTAAFPNGWRAAIGTDGRIIVEDKSGIAINIHKGMVQSSLGAPWGFIESYFEDILSATTVPHAEDHEHHQEQTRSIR